MTTRKRIAKLQASLTPKQVISRWLKASEASESRLDYSWWVLQDPKSRSGLCLTSEKFTAWLTTHGSGKGREGNKQALKGAQRAGFPCIQCFWRSTSSAISHAKMWRFS